MAAMTDVISPPEQARFPSRSRRGPALSRRGGNGMRYLALIVLALIFLFPFYLIIRNALMTQPEITGPVWQWWPAHPQWSNFNLLFDSAPMSTGLRNSVILAGVNLILQTLFASMAGYALARIPVRGRGIAF